LQPLAARFLENLVYRIDIGLVADSFKRISKEGKGVPIRICFARVVMG